MGHFPGPVTFAFEERSGGLMGRRIFSAFGQLILIDVARGTIRTMTLNSGFRTRPKCRSASAYSRPEKSGVIVALIGCGVVFAVMAQTVVKAESPNILAGQRTFMIHCEACHGPGGVGGAGPNLTDNDTLHGGTYEDILEVVTNGVRGKPMNAWENKLGLDRVKNVAAYVFSLKGTRPKSEKTYDGTAGTNLNLM